MNLSYDQREAVRLLEQPRASRTGDRARSDLNRARFRATHRGGKLNAPRQLAEQAPDSGERSSGYRQPNAGRAAAFRNAVHYLFFTPYPVSSSQSPARRVRTVIRALARDTETRSRIGGRPSIPRLDEKSRRARTIRRREVACRRQGRPMRAKTRVSPDPTANQSRALGAR